MLISCHRYQCIPQIFLCFLSTFASLSFSCHLWKLGIIFILLWYLQIFLTSKIYMEHFHSTLTFLKFTFYLKKTQKFQLYYDILQIFLLSAKKYGTFPLYYDVPQIILLSVIWNLSTLQWHSSNLPAFRKKIWNISTLLHSSNYPALCKNIGVVHILRNAS